MPIPLIAYIIGAGIAALVGGGVAYVARHDIAAALTGRVIVILGAHKVGKTVLITYLSEARIITPQDEYKRTAAAINAGRGNAVSSKNNPNLYANKLHDVPGAEDDLIIWEDLFRSATRRSGSLCLYLVDAKRLWDDDAEHIGRIRCDLDRIFDWRKENSSPFVFVVATHMDLVPGWKNGTEEMRSNLESRIRKHSALDLALEKRAHVHVADLSGNADGFVMLFDKICGSLGAKEI